MASRWKSWESSMWLILELTSWGVLRRGGGFLDFLGVVLDLFLVVVVVVAVVVVVVVVSTTTSFLSLLLSISGLQVLSFVGDTVSLDFMSVFSVSLISLSISFSILFSILQIFLCSLLEISIFLSFRLLILVMMKNLEISILLYRHKI